MPIALPCRRGVSVTELIVAIMLLGVLSTAIVQFVTYVNQAIKNRELMQSLHWELESARELIGSWRSEEITQQRIREIPFSASLKERLQNPVWVVEIQPARFHGLVQATTFQSVRLGISASYREQAISPVEVNFWILGAKDQLEEPGSESIVPADENAGSSPDILEICKP